MSVPVICDNSILARLEDVGRVSLGVSPGAAQHDLLRGWLAQDALYSQASESGQATWEAWIQHEIARAAYEHLWFPERLVPIGDLAVALWKREWFAGHTADATALDDTVARATLGVPLGATADDVMMAWARRTREAYRALLTAPDPALQVRTRVEAAALVALLSPSDRQQAAREQFEQTLAWACAPNDLPEPPTTVELVVPLDQHVVAIDVCRRCHIVPAAVAAALTSPSRSAGQTPAVTGLAQAWVSIGPAGVRISGDRGGVPAPLRRGTALAADLVVPVSELTLDGETADVLTGVPLLPDQLTTPAFDSIASWDGAVAFIAASAAGGAVKTGTLNANCPATPAPDATHSVAVTRQGDKAVIDAAAGSKATVSLVAPFYTLDAGAEPAPAPPKGPPTHLGVLPAIAIPHVETTTVRTGRMPWEVTTRANVVFDEPPEDPLITAIAAVLHLSQPLSVGAIQMGWVSQTDVDAAAERAVEDITGDRRTRSVRAAREAVTAARAFVQTPADSNARQRALTALYNFARLKGDEATALALAPEVARRLLGLDDESSVSDALMGWIAQGGSTPTATVHVDARRRVQALTTALIATLAPQPDRDSALRQFTVALEEAVTSTMVPHEDWATPLLLGVPLSACVIDGDGRVYVDAAQVGDGDVESGEVQLAFVPDGVRMLWPEGEDWKQRVVAAPPAGSRLFPISAIHRGPITAEHIETWRNDPLLDDSSDRDGIAVLPVAAVGNTGADTVGGLRVGEEAMVPPPVAAAAVSSGVIDASSQVYRGDFAYGTRVTRTHDGVRIEIDSRPLVPIRQTPPFPTPPVVPDLDL